MVSDADKYDSHMPRKRWATIEPRRNETTRTYKFLSLGDVNPRLRAGSCADETESDIALLSHSYSLEDDSKFIMGAGSSDSSNTEAK